MFLSRVSGAVRWLYLCMDINLHVLLKTPPAGIYYALQKGTGSSYEPIHIQHSDGSDLEFELTILLKDDPDGAKPPRFTGPFAQGKPLEQFFYIDIGSYGGQADFHGGRIKVPLHVITWDLIEKLNGGTLTTTIQGTGKNGQPAYATPKPFAGWKIKT